MGIANWFVLGECFFVILKHSFLLHTTRCCLFLRTEGNVMTNDEPDNQEDIFNVYDNKYWKILQQKDLSLSLQAKVRSIVGSCLLDCMRQSCTILLVLHTWMQKAIFLTIIRVLQESVEARRAFFQANQERILKQAAQLVESFDRQQEKDVERKWQSILYDDQHRYLEF
jgi:hypothetical protein